MKKQEGPSEFDRVFYGIIGLIFMILNLVIFASEDGKPLHMAFVMSGVITCVAATSEKWFEEWLAVAFFSTALSYLGEARIGDFSGLEAKKNIAISALSFLAMMFLAAKIKTKHEVGKK